MINLFRVISGSLFVLFVLTASLFYTGCSDNATEPTATDNAEVSSYGTPAYTDLLDSLKLDTVKMLIKDIKLNVANSSDSTNFKVGPFLYFLNMSNQVNLLTSSMIPAGSYDKINFKVHKLDNSEIPPDPEFKDSTNTYSVVVRGFFNGAHFIFKSDISASQKINFPKKADMTTSSKTNVTLKVEPYKWFYKNGNFLDPRVPANRNDIENNIKNNVNDNIKAFVDNDKNGQADQ